MHEKTDPNTIVGLYLNMTDPNTITGLHLDVTAAELSEHARRRAAHHGERARIYEEKAAEIERLQKEADEETRTISKMSNSSNPADNMEQSAKNHRRRERFFKFAAEHFAAGKTYRLAISDLEQFEIAPARY